ncbi:MAG: hypothetical protein ACRC92_11775 [Peptostreptococcaceae bacterium]
MRNKKVKILFFMSLMFILTLAHATNINALTKETYAPDSLKGIKAFNEYKVLFENLKRVRENMNTINISESTVELKAGELLRQINFYSNELSSIRNRLESNKVQYRNSPADVFLASRIDIVVYSYEITLQQQESLIIAVGKGDIDIDKVFLSEYINNIYYYLSLGDNMIAYLDSLYSFSK